MFFEIINIFEIGKLIIKVRYLFYLVEIVHVLEEEL